MTSSAIYSRLVFADSQMESEYLRRRCHATADVSSLIHALYGVGWAMGGLRLCSKLARSECAVGMTPNDMPALLPMCPRSGWSTCSRVVVTWSRSLIALRRAKELKPARLILNALFYAAGALVNASAAVFLRNRGSPCVQHSWLNLPHLSRINHVRS